MDTVTPKSNVSLELCPVCHADQPRSGFEPGDTLHIEQMLSIAQIPEPDRSLTLRESRQYLWAEGIRRTSLKALAVIGDASAGTRHDIDALWDLSGYMDELDKTWTRRQPSRAESS